MAGYLLDTNVISETRRLKANPKVAYRRLTGVERRG